jgi:hypothetical protein
MLRVLRACMFSHSLGPPREKDESCAKVKDSTLTPYDGVNNGFMFGVSIVDKASAAMSEAREWLRSTPASATMTKRCGNRPEIEFLTPMPVLGPYSKLRVDMASICESRRNPEALQINLPRAKFGKIPTRAREALENRAARAARASASFGR